MKNKMTILFNALPSNEAFARNAVAAFCAELDPTTDEINDIKTVVSEAVTNAIVHGYGNDVNGEIKVVTEILDNSVHIVVSDCGVGIENISNALQPFFTSKPEQERSGMGFTIMESFTDELIVEPNTPNGTVVSMFKTIKGGANWNLKKH